MIRPAFPSRSQEDERTKEMSRSPYATRSSGPTPISSNPFHRPSFSSSSIFRRDATQLPPLPPSASHPQTRARSHPQAQPQPQLEEEHRLPSPRSPPAFSLSSSGGGGSGRGKRKRKVMSFL
ncbi:hypothetical protein BT69DRAFT_9747 [Atractiella rhizophila]|nr:hypothetical protein BT69DRAFT_9747 [Atractiella rhizophila]